jgi:hypothetical protein
MPTTSGSMQKQFKLTIENGLPQAAIDTIGKDHWLLCCPLCGCMHQLQAEKAGASYIPLCQTVPLLYKAQSIIWNKLHPDVAIYKKLHLIAAVN